MQRFGRVGRLAVAIGADDDEHIVLRGEPGYVGLRHVQRHRCKTALAGILGRLLGQALGSASLGSIKNRERDQRRGGRSGRPRRGQVGRSRGTRKETGQVSIQPGALLESERRGVGNDGERVHQLENFS